MPTLICHPDNWDRLKALIDSGKFDNKYGSWAEFRVHTNPHMDRDQPSGKYVMPDGKQVAKECIRIKERFIEYGPEDIEWLLYAGVISEGREMLFYVIDDSYFRAAFPISPPVMDRRIVFSGTS